MNDNSGSLFQKSFDMQSVFILAEGKRISFKTYNYIKIKICMRQLKNLDNLKYVSRVIYLIIIFKVISLLNQIRNIFQNF